MAVMFQSEMKQMSCKTIKDEEVVASKRDQIIGLLSAAV